MAAKFEYAQAEEIRDVLLRHGVRYLFIGKSGAILLGFPDTTQDADLFVDKTTENGARLVDGLRELGFSLSEEQLPGEVRHPDSLVVQQLVHCRIEARAATDFRKDWRRDPQ